MSNFQPLEVVGRGSETQLQVAENFRMMVKPTVDEHLASSGCNPSKQKLLNQCEFNAGQPSKSLLLYD